jgi:hypothetical protein
MAKTALLKQTNSIVPALSIEQAVQLFGDFQRLKSEVLQQGSDVIQIKERPYVCKSGWQKLSAIFNLSFSIIDRSFITKNDFKAIIFRGKVTAPNGRSVEAEGWCSSDEPWASGKSLSSMVGMSQTRTFNRATALMLAPGEVSFEEMVDVEKEEKGDRPNYSTFMRNVTQMGFPVKEVRDACVKLAGKEIHKCCQNDLVKVYDHFNTVFQERQMKKGGF